MTAQLSSTLLAGIAARRTLGFWFEHKTRESGERFVTLRDGRPEWLQDAVCDAHQGALANDWVYAECEAACDAIDAGDLTDDDSIHEFADGRVDIHNSALYSWAASEQGTDFYSYAEEEAGGFLDPTADTLERLWTIQYCAIAAIARTMLEAVNASRADSGES